MVGVICEQEVVAALALSRHSALRRERLEFGPNDKQRSRETQIAGHWSADGAILAKTTDLAKHGIFEGRIDKLSFRRTAGYSFTRSPSLLLKLPEKI